LVSALVLLVAVAAVRLSSRSGLPSLLVYLGIGIVIGQDGLGVQFDDAELTQVLGYAALVLILAEGGLDTKWEEIRRSVPAAAVLSTVGVGVSVAVTATAAHLLIGLNWQTALVLGAVVSSTDAAAVFSVLRRVPLPKRVTGVLEAESGFNDAPVVILVVAFSGLHGGAGPWYELVGTIVMELAIGLVVGLLVGRAGAFGLKRVALPSSGLYPIAVLALCVLAYAGGALAHGSGFLAVYVAAVILGNAKLPHRPAVRGFADGVAWLAQIGMFVLLGLLVTPHDLGDDFVPAIIVGAALTLVARPLSVVVSLLPFRRPWRQQVLLSWAGLRGAVPIVLATIPLAEGVPGADRIFDVVFVLVLLFTLLQGPSLPWLAGRLKVLDENAAHEVDIDVAPLESLGADMLQVHVPSESQLAGVEIGELRLPPGVSVSLVIRGDHAFVPDRRTVLRAADSLLVVAPSPVREQTVRRLRAVSRAGRLAGWFGERGREQH
jgi:cell volume regulation protein A